MFYWFVASVVAQVILMLARLLAGQGKESPWYGVFACLVFILIMIVPQIWAMLHLWEIK